VWENEKVLHQSLLLVQARTPLNSQHLNVLDPIIPKDQKNITTLKGSTGQLCTAATQHLTHAVVVNKYLEKSDPSEALKKENYIANSV
jgi:hypothetical protein